MTATMPGVAKVAPGEGHVELAERPVREAGPGQVLLRVAGAGICGTDLHIEAGEYPSVPPVTMGHEVCGVVEAVGPGVDAAWLGERVVCETYYATCGRCAYCRDGRPNLCPQRQSIGTHVDGAFAPRLVLPAHNLHRVPDGIGSHEASMAEPVACACQSVLAARAIVPGDAVTIVGPGAIGLVAAQVARAAGGRVTVRGTARDGARLDLARELGFATAVAGAGADEPAAPPDVVVECSGSEPGVAWSLEALRRGGHLIQMGLRGLPLTVPFDEICFKELVVTAGFASTPRSWRQAMRLLQDGSVVLGPLLSEVVPLDEFRRAFDASRAADGVKFVLDPSGAR